MNKKLLSFMAGLVCLSLAGCGVPSESGPADSFGLDFSLPQGMQTKGAIVFFVDGVNGEVFQEMLEAGELPAIEKYFVARGLYAPRAVANTPSVTLANLTSFVTGQFPGHHGVTGINWFDRNQLIWRNYETIAQKNTLDGDYTASTIYEHFPQRTTMSIFFQPHRGTTKFVENWMSAGPPFFFGWYEFVDRLTLSRLDIYLDIARKRKALPAVAVCYLLAPDFRAYANGVSSKVYRKALKHTDTQIGRVLGDIERGGLLDEIIIALVSDHSLADVKKHFPMNDFLKNQLGLNIAGKRLWEETPLEKRLDCYQKYSAVTYGSGDRYLAICLRKPIRDETGKLAGYEPWTTRPLSEDMKNYPGDLNLLDRLTELEAVDAIAYSVGVNRVRVRNKRGEVEFHQNTGRGGKISYKKISGKDPLGWQGQVPADALNGQGASGRDWLEWTFESNYPDLPAQIVAYFRARRAGDIAVFAAEGWDFNNKNKAGHGGLHHGDMMTPLLIAGPGVPKGKLGPTRVIDITATLLELLGKELPKNLDGESFLGKAHHCD